MPLIPDYVKFVNSLTDAQATFLHAELQEVRGRRAMALREALLHRVLDSPDRASLREKMVHNFYSPTEPIIAVMVPGSRSKKRR